VKPPKINAIWRFGAPARRNPFCSTPAWPSAALLALFGGAEKIKGSRFLSLKANQYHWPEPMEEVILGFLGFSRCARE
jgi:hypothetical protein